jgi:hypothetical protein
VDQFEFVWERARLQPAEKLDVADAFGWRSGSPLRSVAYFQMRLLSWCGETATRETLFPQPV